MIVHDVDQGSPEWFAARAGVVSASELDALITPLWKPRAGDGVETYLCTKVAERWTGGPLLTFGGGVLEQGSLREAAALPMFSILTDLPARKAGFITTDDGRLGCSPDGLLDDGSGLEIKSPQPANHVRYLRAGALPKEYAAQVHGSMLVTGARRWHFMSYNPAFPPLILVVERDEAICDAIREAAGAFNDRLDLAYQSLCEMNGGESARRKRP